MQRQGVSKLGSVLLIIIVIVIAAAGIIWAGRTIFGDDQSDTGSDPGKDALTNITADSGVRMTVRGPITAEETHRSYQITVKPNSRNLTTYKGYLSTVIQSENLSNNTAAYQEFSYALNYDGMMSGSAFDGDKNDTRGVCPTGQLIIFETLNGDSVVKQLWTTTCSSNPGSFTGKYKTIQTLFNNQIPDSSKLISDSKK